jgi:hypothetical protein
VALGPWIAGQLGFHGGQIVTVFEGGRFSLNVTSWMMGLSIYVRAAVVGLILTYWWRHPGEIVARSALPVPGSRAEGAPPGPAVEAPTDRPAGSPVR